MTRKSKPREDAKILFKDMERMFKDACYGEVKEDFLINIFKLKLIEQAQIWKTKYDELLGINKEKSKTPYPTPIYDFIRACSVGFTADGTQSLGYIKLDKKRRYFILNTPISKWNEADVVEYYVLFTGKSKKKGRKIPNEYLRRSCAKVWSNAKKRYPLVSLDKFVQIYKEALDKFALDKS